MATRSSASTTGPATGRSLGAIRDPPDAVLLRGRAFIAIAFRARCSWSATAASLRRTRASAPTRTCRRTTATSTSASTTAKATAREANDQKAIMTRVSFRPFGRGNSKRAFANHRLLDNDATRNADAALAPSSSSYEDKHFNSGFDYLIRRPGQPDRCRRRRRRLVGLRDAVLQGEGQRAGNAVPLRQLQSTRTSTRFRSARSSASPTGSRILAATRRRHCWSTTTA